MGVIIALVGIGIWAAARLNLPVGKLPGDISLQKGRTTFYFPIATSLVLSVILTAVLWFIQSLRK